MKKSLLPAAVALLMTTQAFAVYWTVLKDGTKYKAKAKPVIANGRATLALVNGEILTFDPSLIDWPKSEATTKSGLGDATILGTQQQLQQGAPSTQTSSLSGIHLRKQPITPAPAPAPQPEAPATNSNIAPAVIANFERAFENVGIFEHTVRATGAHAIRADLTTDNEEKVFNALSAASFLILHNAGVAGTQIDEVELYMKTTTGGAAGRFKVSRADAEALESKKVTRQEYFIHNVLF